MTRIGWLLAFALACAAPPTAAAPLEAYGRLPFIEQVAISPDGARLAVIVSDGEKRQIIIKQLSDGKIVGGVNSGAVKVRWLQWAGPGHVLITSSSTTSIPDLIGPRDEWYMTVDFDISRLRQRALLDHVEESMNVVVGAPAVRTIDGKLYAFITGIHFVDDYGRLAVFKVDLDRG